MTSPLDETGPDLYLTNAFRVTGLPVGATSRDIRRRDERLRAMEKYGVAAAGDGILPLPRTPDEDTRDRVVQRLRDPAKRLVDELFWFWPAPDGPDDAVAALRDGDVEAAERAWRARSTPVARHNLAVLAHVRALDAAEPDRALWDQALANWRAVIDDEAFWELFRARIVELDDARLSPVMARRVRRELPAALLSINARLALEAWRADRPGDGRSHLEVISGSGFDRAVIDDVLRGAVRPERDRVAALCEAAERDSDTDPEHAGTTGDRLADQTAPLLGTLGFVLPDDDPARSGAQDQVARQVMRCAVAYGNHTRDWRATLVLLRRAHPIAVTETVRADIERNLEVVRGNATLGMCWFCKRQPGTEDGGLPYAMFGNVRRQGYEVHWQHGTVKVPRCEACEARHTIVGRLWAIGALSSGALAFATLILFVNGHGVIGTLALLATLAVVIAMAATTPQGMSRRERSSIRRYGPIKKKLEQGWAFGGRPPGLG